MTAQIPTAELKQQGQFACSFNIVSTLPVARGLAHELVILRTKRINCRSAFAYYAGPEAVKGLRKSHDKWETVSKNALKKVERIILPEFYKKVAAEMQEEKTALLSLQKRIDTIIIEQWVSMHLNHPHNGQYVRLDKGVYHRQGLGCVSTRLHNTFSFSV